jgi:hypothetical protein
VLCCAETSRNTVIVHTTLGRSSSAVAAIPIADRRGCIMSDAAASASQRLGGGITKSTKVCD